MKKILNKFVRVLTYPSSEKRYIQFNFYFFDVTIGWKYIPEEEMK